MLLCVRQKFSKMLGQSGNVGLNGVPGPKRLYNTVIVSNDIAEAVDSVPGHGVGIGEFTRESAGQFADLENRHKEHVEVGGVLYEEVFVNTKLLDARRNAVAVFENLKEDEAIRLVHIQESYLEGTRF